MSDFKVYGKDTSFLKVSEPKGDPIKDFDFSKGRKEGGVTIDTERQRIASEALKQSFGKDADKSSALYEKEQDYKFQDNKLKK